MSNYHAASQAKKGSLSGKRLSWTGLGLTNSPISGQKNGMNVGLVALEMARKDCKNCDGHTGREVTWLARYVNIGATVVKQTAHNMNGGIRRTS
jgi:hypothetical protein